MKKLFLISVLISIFSHSSAQINQEDDIQRRQQQEQQDMLRRREMQMSERSVGLQEAEIPDISAPQIPQEQDTQSGCLDIKTLNITGIHKLNLGKIKKRSQTLAGRCVTKKALQDIQKYIQNLYIYKGYLGARVYFDFKGLNDKRLDIIVSEGTLEDIILLNPATKEPRAGLSADLQKLTAFPFTVNHVLQLRDIEQGLEQMNKLASNNAVMEMRPGKNEGSSVIIIDNDVLPKNDISLSYDNSGSDNTGRYRTGLTYSRDNLLSLNENIYLNANSTVFNNMSKNYSRSLSASISVPFGYWSVNNSFNYSKYLTNTQGALLSFDSSGDSFTNISSLERVLARGKSYKASAGAMLALKNSKNYFEDEYIDTSSRILSIGSLYMTGTYYSRAGYLFSKLSLNKGLHAFGAPKDEDNLPQGAQKSQFTNLNLYLNYSKNISIFNYVFAADGQYSFDNLFPSEQMMIGGEYSVRGFREHNAYGESGFTLRQDLKIPLSAIFGISRNEYLNRFLSTLYIGGFFDYGRVFPKTFGNAQSLAGAGGKITYYGKYLNGSFSYARSVYRPEDIPDEGKILCFNLGLHVGF
ncbi:MAG: ShlB/FhaC/HecB family hemolysin secretion/activation protein [Elusimicrobiota bacterium]|jgi:hemolysin activation/secretion protein|nr:ShlB/FhaC/HecB family hemolysin secretion/activation protein [Elusimicrobiota bacterium]